MKRIILLLPAILFLLNLGMTQTNNFWTRVPGPSGGVFRNLTRTTSGTLYVQPDYSYSKTSPFPSRLYRSADQGLNWTAADLTLNGQFLNSYVDVGRSGAFTTLVLDSTLTNNALYRSFDEGITWTLTKDSLPFRAVYETPSGALLARTATTKDIWRSADGGQTWTVTFTPNGSINSDLQVLENGDLIFVSTTFETYRSWDDGLSWQIIGQTATSQSPFYITQAGTLLVPKASNLYRSVNNGLTWEIVILAGFQLKTIAILASGELLGCDPVTHKLYRSANDGQTWTPVVSDHPITQLFRLRLPDGTVFGYCNEALYRSADGGQSWQCSAQGMDLAPVSQMAFVSTDTMFAMTLNGLWHTTDRGQQWGKLTDNKTEQVWAYPESRSFVAGQNGFLAAFVGDSLFASNDYGEHFTSITPPGGIFQPAVELSPGDSFLFVNSDAPRRVMRSADKGQSWQDIFNQASVFKQIVFHPSGRAFAILAIGSSPFNFWYSDDRGLSWLPVTAIPAGFIGSDVHVDQAGNVYLIGEDPDSSYPLYRSLDNGQSWQRQAPANGFFAHRSLAHNASGHLFSYYFGLQMQRSIDQGLTWNQMPDLPAIGNGSYRVTTDNVSPDQYLYIGHSKHGLFRTKTPTTQGTYLGGTLRRDADADCSTPDAQAPIANWIVEANGAYSYFAQTAANGQYLMFVDTGAYAVQAHVPNAVWWAVCDSVQTVQAHDLNGQYSADFSAAALAECPLVTVDLAVPTLRRCFDNALYVNYCNEGTEMADSAWVDVTLDPLTSFVSATRPATSMGFNIYRFGLGNLPFGECGQFRIVVHVDCDSTVLGQTHCFTAHGYPDTLCTPVNGWSGAQINASVHCLDTLLRFELRNTGTAPSQVLDYGIIVDDVVLMNGQKQYSPDEVLTLDQPADGHTWRIESEQEPGHPFSNIAVAFSEGCGGFGSLGFINRFGVDEYQPSWDRDCIQNIGSYDPNDKQGFPLGTTEDHLIRPGQELEYLVRFQNTGTDTAFTVVVRDTLSPWLDPASVRPGAASHPYTWALSGQGVLSFIFSNILLPDSNVNEAASHGFISFRIEQQPDVPLGAVIYNKADIYFDFNEPVETNQTWHTVGVPAITGVLPAPSKPSPSEILVSPQPVGSYTVLRRSDGQPFGRQRLSLLDALGRTVRTAELNGVQYRFEREGLPAGLYFYRIEAADGRPAGAGSLVIQP